jgi:hypothetical protein
MLVQVHRHKAKIERVTKCTVAYSETTGAGNIRSKVIEVESLGSRS